MSKVNPPQSSEETSSHGQTKARHSFSSSLEGTRRQRISMACLYCRRRKIRCCGGSPCRNCQRSKRECDYAPVPEEDNRTTREKKAFAKASKIANQLLPPATTSSPYHVSRPTYHEPVYGPSVRSAPYVLKRASSMPGEAMPMGVPLAYDPPQWIYSQPNYHFAPPNQPSLVSTVPPYSSHFEEPLVQGPMSSQQSAQFDQHQVQPLKVLDTPSPTSSSMSSFAALTRTSSSDDEHVPGTWLTPGLSTPLYLPPVSSGPLSPSFVQTAPCPGTLPTLHQTSTPPTPTSMTFPSPHVIPTLFFPYAHTQPTNCTTQSVPADKNGQSPMISGSAVMMMKEPLSGLGLVENRDMYLGHGIGEDYYSPPLYHQEQAL
ncbi:hypothetical protein I314_03794 [Cryptococcus bacillisporus CA1873]|uniref:Zn(2)-C6 fungal-type domain-containing protein n=1 Tax=Cryptococcus bacillisporus CA1873 TaxID=1296111 RepID=A0ABR5BAD8_CRYGA|nr:hypothetical protein I314_03794 [Cryptococcus bacillisporus CA1873]|eukprot:KIR60498.1 hypothetical protein I314_03794 [Cryptococcus gattii CA1873]